MLETVDAADLKDLAEKEEHTMFSEQSSVHHPDKPSIRKITASKQTILFQDDDSPHLIEMKVNPKKEKEVTK